MTNSKKACKIQLDRLFDHPELGSKENLLQVPEELVVKEKETNAKSIRMTRAPQKLSSFFCDKLSGHCPGCRVFVDNGENGVVCERCNAYWHYECAKVTQEDIDTIWKEEFVCEMHRQPTKGSALSKMAESKAHSINDNKIGDGNPVLVDIKINSYAMNKISLLRYCDTHVTRSTMS